MSVLVSTSPRPRARLSPIRVGLYLLLAILAIFYLTPVFAIVVTSLKTTAELARTTVWDLPHAFSLDSYSTAFQALAPSFFNSVLLVVPATILSATLGSLNGYVLSKWQFKGANLVFTLLLFGMFIPYQSILIPLVQFLETINLYGGIPGLVLVHVVYGIPICTLIFRNYFATVPKELLEAARIDGASVLGIYRHVMLPISIPGFVVVMIWQFTSIWNEFLFAVTIAQTPTQQPITVALQNLAGSLAPEQNVQMAGALMAALPTLLIYILLGRYFVRGLLAGSLKG
jgi:glucose/mannose transport system permease protein